MKGSKPIPPINRFFSKVAKTESCWLWTRCDSNSYGNFFDGNRLIKAHRFIYEYTFGKIPSSKILVCHKCDVRACVNPDHLFLGSHRDNTQDGIKKGRIKLQRPWSACKAGHVRTKENTRISKRENGSDRLICRMCVKLRMRKYREIAKYSQA